MHSARDPILLLVEDSDDDAYFFKRIFRKTGLSFSIEHALDGAKAIEFLRQAAAADSLPQIIFLDLKMPVLNGFDVLIWLRQQPFAEQIQVVVLSGSEQEQDIRRATELGAIDYVIKPILPSHLHRHLDGFASHVDMVKGHPAENGAVS